MLISFDELPEDLRRYVPVLQECVRLALGDFVREHGALRARYTPRTEASIIHDYMAWHAKDRFQWKLRRNLLLLQVENFRVKLKKLDGRLRPRNIPTNLVLQFEHQEPLTLFGDLDPTHLLLGYQRDDEILKSAIWLVCPDGKGISWAAELPGDEAAEITLAVVSPTLPSQAEPGRVRPRIAAQGKEGARTAK